MNYSVKSIIRTAHQWFRNGDHPEDGSTESQKSMLEGVFVLSEGNVVRHYRDPSVSGEQRCGHCGYAMHSHGWIDSGGYGRTVCPGDFILTSDDGQYFPVKPDLVAAFLNEEVPTTENPDGR